MWMEKGAGINVPPGPQVGWTGAPPVFGVHSDWTHRLSRALSRRSGSRDLLAPRPQCTVPPLVPRSPHGCHSISDGTWPLNSACKLPKLLPGSKPLRTSYC